MPWRPDVQSRYSVLTRYNGTQWCTRASGATRGRIRPSAPFGTVRVLAAHKKGLIERTHGPEDLPSAGHCPSPAAPSREGSRGRPRGTSPEHGAHRSRVKRGTVRCKESATLPPMQDARWRARLVEGASHPGSATWSSSKKAIQSPADSAIPRLRAQEIPASFHEHISPERRPRGDSLHRAGCHRSRRCRRRRLERDLPPFFWRARSPATGGEGAPVICRHDNADVNAGHRGSPSP
jgi:hypothetical protein